MLTKSYYAIEVEIKMSRADFKADFKKAKKHKLLASMGRAVAEKAGQKYQRNLFQNGVPAPTLTYLHWIEPKNNVPNRFYFCCPKGMIALDELPDYAGLLWVGESGLIMPGRPAPLIHKERFDNFKRIASRFDREAIRMRTRIKCLQMDIKYNNTRNKTQEKAYGDIRKPY